MRLGIIDNDGYNALSLGKNSSALKAFWIQLKVNELASKGVRLKDMPDELFVIPNNEEMKNSMVAASGVFTCNRLIDEHKFEEAQKLINNFLKSDTAIIGLHRNLLICDEIYCKIILGNDKEEINSLLSKEQKKFMKSMKRFPSVVRTEYVYALLIEEDNDKADKIKNIFNKILGSNLPQFFISKSISGFSPFNIESINSFPKDVHTSGLTGRYDCKNKSILE